MDTKRLRSLRKSKGYTQKQIAEFLRISQGTYSDYEHGRINIPVDSLVKLARLYEVSLDFIVGLSDDKSPK